MKLVIAGSAGFCGGVRRAVAICERAAADGTGAVMLGPVIHNRAVIARLAAMGIKVVANARAAPRGAPVIIRSHGAGGGVYERLRERWTEIIDATCPKVAKIHEIVRNESAKGRLIVIIGERNHPEVEAIAGWCDRSVALPSPAELENWLALAPENRRSSVSVVFQTTVTREVFSLCEVIIKKECTNHKIFDTICGATRNRQREALRLAEEADAMIVIGGRDSANSRRLAEICAAACARVAFIETVRELDATAFADCQTVGITAGASTPACNIKEVIQKMSEDLRLDGIPEVTEVPPTTETAGDPGDGVSADNDAPGECADIAQETAGTGAASASDEVLPDAVLPDAGAREHDGDSSAAPDAESAPQLIPETREVSETDFDTARDADGTGAESGRFHTGDAIDINAEAGAEAEAEADAEADAAAKAFEEMLVKSIKTLHTGERVTGTVMAVTPTEVTVDLGIKQSGYIPISELSGQGDEEEGIVKIGDEIEGFVVRVNDVEGTVMLSKKRLNAIKNWDSIDAARESKAILEGNVVEDNSGGVVVMVKGVRVFVPASQTGVPRETPLSTLVRTRVRLVITEMDENRRRVIGSIRSAARAERRERAAALWSEIEPGKKYTGTVRSLTTFGAFVDIGGADGLLHNSEISWNRIKKPEEILSVGDEIEVTVISVDKEKKKISLRYKNEEDDPWLRFVAGYSVGDIINVKIVRLMSFGAFAEIIPNVDGLIHISQIADFRVETPGSVLSLGQNVDVRITGVDEERKKISLSIKALQDAPARTHESGDNDEEDGGAAIVYDTSAPTEWGHGPEDATAAGETAAGAERGE
jgi:4-hydroxy-3-methylbut-2-enyl diphosphate reductase